MAPAAHHPTTPRSTDGSEEQEEEVCLLYSKSNVHLHLDPSGTHSLSGFISLLYSPRSSTHYLAWIPVPLVPTRDREAFVRVDLDPLDPSSPRTVLLPHSTSEVGPSEPELSVYTVCEPLGKLASITILPPSLTRWHGSVTTIWDNGSAWPPLWFHPSRGESIWGGEVLLCHLRDLGLVLSSPPHEPNVLYIQPPPTPLPDSIREMRGLAPATPTPRSLSQGHIPSSKAPFSPHHASASTTTSIPLNIISEPTTTTLTSTSTSTSTHTISPSSSSTSLPPPDPPFGMDPLVHQVREARWQVLERFSKVTQLSRATAGLILDHPLVRPVVPHLPTSLASLSHDSQDPSPSPPDNRAPGSARAYAADYQPAAVYLAKWAAAAIQKSRRDQRLQDAMDAVEDHHDERIEEDSNADPLLSPHEQARAEAEAEPIAGHGHAHGLSYPTDPNVPGDLGAFEMMWRERGRSGKGKEGMGLAGSAHLPKLGARRTEPVGPAAWLGWLDLEGTLTIDSSMVREAIFAGGIEHDIRPAVWPFLLGVWSWDGTDAEREAERADGEAEYNRLKASWKGREAEWLVSMGKGRAEDGERIIEATPERQAERDAYDGFSEERHRIEKDVMRTDRSVPEYAGDRPLQDVLGTPVEIAMPGMPRGNASLRALEDILLTYNEYEPELGYVQGMSDLLSPIFAVMRDESMAFWCFVKFMERMKPNFSKDQQGMREQLVALERLLRFMRPTLHLHLEKTDSLHLFFCFRWILIWFKREFPFAEVMRLWEVLWTDARGPSFHLFVALAILDLNSDVIIEHLVGFDEILKYVNDLAMTLDLDEVLVQAEVLHKEFLRALEFMDAQVTEMTNGEGSSEEERVRVDERGRVEVAAEAEALKKLILRPRE